MPKTSLRPDLILGWIAPIPNKLIPIIQMCTEELKIHIFGLMSSTVLFNFVINHRHTLCRPVSKITFVLANKQNQPQNWSTNKQTENPTSPEVIRKLKLHTRNIY